MIYAFKLCNSKLLKLNTNKPGVLVKSLWIDIVNPTKEERIKIKNELNQTLVTKSKLKEIEASSRFFEDENGVHIHSFFFYSDSAEHVGNSTVSFTINKNKLYSVREREFLAFRVHKKKYINKKLIGINNVYELLLNLFETKIEQLADEIEGIYSNLESLSFVIMNNQKSNEYNNALSQLSKFENVSWKVRLCLMDTQRALNFIVRKFKLSIKQLKKAREIIRDIESLSPHNESLFQRVNFLTQAAMGFINIEQNRIIKIFSVMSVVFLPPTLIASSYGMNFKFMPELSWKFGYPIAILIMIVVGLTPYFYFKKKNWL
ncbi:MAG: magnesium/cobalt transporter CorA [Enterobacteriaceae bacterium]